MYKEYYITTYKKFNVLKDSEYYILKCNEIVCVNLK